TLLGDVGIAGGGHSETATATISGDGDAYIGAKQGTASNGKQTRIDVSGPVAITAQSANAIAKADTEGGTGAVGISVTLATSTATIGGSVRAYMGDLGPQSGTAPAKFHAGSLDVEAIAPGRNAKSIMNPVAIGLVGGGAGPTNPNVVGSKAA